MTFADCAKRRSTSATQSRRSLEDGAGFFRAPVFEISFWPQSAVEVCTATRHIEHQNMKAIIAVLGTLLISAIVLHAAEAARFVQKVKLPSGQTVVVAEGDLEPRSIGSYSVRLYSGENLQFATDNFLAGVIHERDGFIEKIVLADLDGDGREEFVVIVRSAGTGSFLSAHAFAIGVKNLSLRASVTGLARDADAISALKKAQKKRQPR